jgi:recombinational DNA repair protein RecR
LKLEHPPRFFIDLESASEDELQLLPDIGVKTARAWREALDKSFVSLPRKVQELEALPNVGPIRSSKLAPFLVESESCSTTCLDPVTDPARPSVNP